MKRVYIILMTIAVLMSAGLFLFDDKKPDDQLSPQKLLLEINDDSRYWSTDLVADKIIKHDPALLLIDVRSNDQYEEFSLPGALNIPLENILDEEWQGYFLAEDFDIVLFSNDEIYAGQAWILLRRLNYKNLRVMQGGLNHWAETIMQPLMPKQSAPQEAFELYDFRRAANQYFGGGSGEIQPVDTETIQVTRKKKKSAVEGGC